MILTLRLCSNTRVSYYQVLCSISTWKMKPCIFGVPIPQYARGSTKFCFFILSWSVRVRMFFQVHGICVKGQMTRLLLSFIDDIHEKSKIATYNIYTILNLGTIDEARSYDANSKLRSFSLCHKNKLREQASSKLSFYTHSTTTEFSSRSL